MSDQQAKTNGAHHVGLTIPNLDEARAFFIDVLGFKQVGEVPDYPAAFLSDESIMITLWQAENPETAVPFDRRANIGLHHLALSVTDISSLATELAARHDVDIEFEPEGLGDSGIEHMMCRIPGNIRLEFIAA
jgi:catechol 2,3-dioxygenase-like lactoylglutathione lyase family enzyme